MNRQNEDQNIELYIDSIRLDGILNIPNGTKGLVIFAHGSGSSRFSPRNSYVAKELQKDGIGTLLIDLLTEKEDEIYENRFDIDLLAERLEAVTEWAVKEPATSKLSIGYFGASTGSAAAIKAAVGIENKISALVSRGGRVDLAASELISFRVPTLLVVGSNDPLVMALNEEVYDKIQSDKKIEIVFGASHLFEEPGALEKVARVSSEWFQKYLV